MPCRGLFTFGVAAAIGAEARFLRASDADSQDQVASINPCTCLEWKMVYRDLGVQCGEGLEFFHKARKAKLTNQEIDSYQRTAGKDTCKRLFTRLRDNVCFNLNVGEDNGQWCYTSSECQELNGGEIVEGKNVAYKKCNATEGDHLTRDMQPEVLEEMTRQHELDLSFAHKMAYVTVDHLFWRDVKPFFKSKKDREAMPEDIRDEVQRIVDSGVPTSIDVDEDRLPPHRIIAGKRVYGVEPDMFAAHLYPGTWARIKCWYNCK